MLVMVLGGRGFLPTVKASAIYTGKSSSRLTSASKLRVKLSGLMARRPRRFSSRMSSPSCFA